MLSSLIVTRQIQSKTHSDQFTEFRPDTKAYLSGARLINVGADATAGSDPLYYPCNTGADALIENVLIYSGNTLISDCREFSRYAPIVNGQRGNAYQFSVLPQLKKTRQGTINKFIVGVNENLGYGYVRATLRDPDAINNAVLNQNGNRSLIRLSDFNEFLKATPTLNYIPNLRIVVRWNNLATTGYLDNPDSQTVTAWSIARPMLVMDEIVDEKSLAAIKPMMTVNYLNVDYDKQNTSTIASGVNKTTLQPSGFNGRYLKDITFAVQPSVDSDEDISGLAQFVARQLQTENWQLYINNSNIIQQSGIDSPARKMYFSKISRGAMANTLFHYAPYADYAPQALSWDRIQYQVGHSAYLSVGVEDFISSVKFLIDNTYDAVHTDLNSGAQVHMFGRTARTLNFSGNNVVTSF